MGNQDNLRTQGNQNTGNQGGQYPEKKDNDKQIQGGQSQDFNKDKMNQPGSTQGQPGNTQGQPGNTGGSQGGGQGNR